MKPLLLAFILASPLSAAVVYSGEQNLTVGNDLEGIYINIATGATVNAWPDDFEDAPWINITLGGYGIFNSELVEPMAASGGASYDPEQESDYFLNLAAGTPLDGSGSFMENAWASQFHLGATEDPGKFVVGESGLLGFQFREEAGGDIFYGWLRFTPNNGSGTIVDWAFNDTPGEGIQAGVVPEPAAAILLTAAFGMLAARRRRV